jgi:DNA-binding GntR family transcriptional regulator
LTVPFPGRNFRRHKSDEEETSDRVATDQVGPAELQFETLPRTTLRLHAHSMLRDEIVSGRLRPGDKINEVHVSAAMGVSRGTLREAMRVLEQEGLLRSIPHRGTYVRRIDTREARELQEVRLALEITAAVHDATHWSTEIERFLRERFDVLDRTYRTGSFLERARADLSFHEAFVEAAGNRILLRTWRSLVGSITVMVLSVGEAEMTKLQDPGDHKALLDAVASRDADEIRRTFTSHFEHGQRVVERAMSRASTGKADERSQ